MKRYVLIAKMMIVFIAIIIITLCVFYRMEIKPMSKSGENIGLTVEQGETWYTLGATLYEKNLIRSYKFYKIYIKLFRPGNVEAGNYLLNSNMSLPEIVEALEHGESTNPNLVNITFNEGINMRRVASIIETNTNNKADDVFKLLEDENYIDSLIKKYWFLTDDIKDENIYYPLEGYLFPSTYQIDKTKDVATIFETMLDEMDKVLSKYKKDIEKSDLSIHEIITLASIVELEAGNASDRSDVAGVFFNRVKNYWTLGSDVTTYYALKIDDFSYSLSTKELATCNKYNTRSTCFNGLPVGPISNPGLESLKATINPTDTNAYYFVADCDGKTYLSKTLNEHDSIISKLKREDNWCQ